MSQYKTGTASVTNNSPTVTGSGTLWLANVTAGDSFTVAGDGVMYDVASVDSDTQVTLSAPYAGTTASGVVYAIGTGFTVPDSFPEMSQGDIETATIFTRAMRKIQGKISSILAGGASANFTAMPQVGGDPIVESGSNADGEWTRWADGKQTCESPQMALSFSNASNIKFTWDYPAAFISTPTVVPILVYTDFYSKYRTTATTLQYVRVISTTSATIGLASAGAWITDDAAGDPMQGLASGRWK
jgi:hypothetical protein